MENVVLTVHLLLALALIGAVLLQRSEGGGLGMGGGGGAISGRAAATAMTKATWMLAIGFICTSIALTIIAAGSSGGESVLDQISDTPVKDAPEQAPANLEGDDLLPPAPSSNEPLAPKAD